MNLLSLVTFIPLAGAVIILCLPKEKVRAIQATALGAAGLSFLISVYMLAGFDRATPAMRGRPRKTRYPRRCGWVVR